MISTIAALFLQLNVTQGIQSPAYAPDGRLAVAIRGDIWIQSTNGRWSQVTSGPAWDREPAWSADGKTIAFSSNRNGSFDIWQVALSGDTAAAAPVAVATSPDVERSPAFGDAGRLLFARGNGSQSRVYIRDADGRERRLTNNKSAELTPAVSPDRRWLAYVIATETARRLVVRSIAADTNARRADSTIVSNAALEHPAWAPDGTRLSYTTGGQRPGVYVVPLSGRYNNLVATRFAETAWSPDGRQVAMTDLVDDVSYNGDPDRLGDRDVNLLASGSLAFVPAPAAIADAVPSIGPAVASRSEFNARAFDESWQRVNDLYYRDSSAAGRRAQWARARDSYRPRALAAKTDDDLRDVIHAMMRDRPALREQASGRAAISSAHPVATAAGLEILRKGGNVVDAAVAVSFALGVVEPDASGVGGYGEMLVFRSGMAAPKLIEFMSRVPEDASLSNADLDRLPDDGPVLANVPGTVAAMHLAWRQYGSGKVTWADLLAPAIRAARDGYVVSEGLGTTLSTEREHFLKYDGSKALFFRNGKPLAAGDTIRNTDLANTLQSIATGGADAFYKGDVARKVVSDLRSRGNAIKASDMSRYYAVEREPVASTYRGYPFYSSTPPVAGGAQLAGTMNNLELFASPKPYTEDAATLHAMLSAWLLTPSSRNRIADPGLFPVNLEPFTNKDTARTRWRCFDARHAPTSSLFRGDTLVCGAEPAEAKHDGVHSSGTTSFSVADADGNVVTVTQTLGTWGGNFYVSPGLGFLYNDKLRSYGTDAGGYGSRLAFARHGSTLAPTIVFSKDARDRRPLVAFGAAGNNWITSAVFETMTGLVDLDLDPQAALEQPRFHVSLNGLEGQPLVQLEDGFSPSVVRRLEELGYRVQMVSLPGELREGYGSAVRIRNGKALAGADPRRAGAAGAIP